MICRKLKVYYLLDRVSEQGKRLTSIENDCRERALTKEYAWRRFYNAHTRRARYLPTFRIICSNFMCSGGRPVTRRIGTASIYSTLILRKRKPSGRKSVSWIRSGPRNLGATPMAKGLENTHRRHVREKTIIDHVARELYEPKPEPAAEKGRKPPWPDHGHRIVRRGSGPQGVGSSKGGLPTFLDRVPPHLAVVTALEHCFERQAIQTNGVPSLDHEAGAPYRSGQLMEWIRSASYGGAPLARCPS